MTAFGELLAGYRTAAGLTQEELAERAALSVRGLRYLERGLRQPYRDTVERLVRALDLSPEDQAALRAVARASPVGLPSGAGWGGRGNMPVPLTPLIGREWDVRGATELLRREHVRLLTLTGPGGVGKTRLAIEVATHLASDFTDGLVWIPLASLADARLVPSAIAQALGLVETGRRPLPEVLAHWLGERQVLLLLDNFEHLAASAALVGDLLARCRRVKALITSRAALRLSGEHEFPVQPLQLPNVDQQASVYALAVNPAVDLFLRRAQAVTPDFALTQANASVVAAVCWRLDGLPLALELAAARIRVLPPQAMLDRLNHRLTFLTGGAIDRRVRQRTMRETIAWSYDLLGADEQMLFRRLGVFAGGCDLSAAEAVCNPSHEFGMEVLDGIEVLQRNSLIRLQQASEEQARFVMLETIREYAWERLAASPEEDDLRKRHATFYMAFAEAGAPQLLSPTQGAWLDRLDQEHDNLRAALRWCMAHGDAELGLRLTAALSLFWYMRGYAEGRAHLAGVLALPEAARVTAPRAASLLGAGQLALWQGDYAAARTAIDESLELYGSLGDDRGRADALLMAGFLRRVEEEYEPAGGFLEQALALSRVVGYQFITAASLHHLGMMAADARQDYAEARHLLEKSLELYRALDLPRFIGLVACSLGDVVRAEGDYSRAHALLQEALTRIGTVDKEMTISLALEACAHLAMDEGQAERAVRLAGAAARLRELSGASEWPTVQRTRERWLSAARASLGNAAFSAAWATGQSMTPAAAFAFARAEVVGPETPA
jgi:predicted ATPase/DNA-binding XRE family transcriptional regulator